MKLYILTFVLLIANNLAAQAPTMTIKNIDFENRYGGFVYIIEINNPTKDTLVLMHPDIFSNLSNENPFEITINVDKKRCDEYYADVPYSVSKKKFLGVESVIKINPKSIRKVGFSQELHSYCMDNDAKVLIKMKYKTPGFYNKKEVEGRSEALIRLAGLLKPAVEFSEKMELDTELRNQLKDIEWEIKKNQEQMEEIKLAEAMNLYKGIIESNEYNLVNRFSK